MFIHDETPNPSEGVRVITTGTGDAKLSLPGGSFVVNGVPVSGANYVISGPANVVVTKTASILLDVDEGTVFIEFIETGIIVEVEQGEIIHVDETSNTEVNLEGVEGTITVTVGGEETELEAGQSIGTVNLDIKPGSDPNSINPNSKGEIPVAVLSTENFDATTIDASTVSFGAATQESHNTGHIEDVNGDGLSDMVLHFMTPDVGITDQTELCISGQTTDGVTIIGCDAVNLVGGNDSDKEPEGPKDDGNGKGNEGKGNDKKK